MAGLLGAFIFTWVSVLKSSALSHIKDLLLTINSESKTVLSIAHAIASCPVIDCCEDCMNGVVNNLNEFSEAIK